MKKVFHINIPPGLWPVILLVIAGFVTGLMHVFLMPPFQNPDEIQHFLHTAGYAYSPQEMKKVESSVLVLLKEYRWFHFVGIGAGWEKTKEISDISFVFHFETGKKNVRKTLFHYFYGKILKVSGISDTLTAFYFLRVLSMFLYTGTLILSYFFFKRYFPLLWKYLLAGLVLIFQFGTIMNSINYDVLMVVVGTLFFMQAYRFLNTGEGKGVKTRFVSLLLLAALAVLTKIAGLMFFLFLLLLPWMKIRRNLSVDLKFLRNAAIIIIIFVLGFSWLNYMFPGRFFNLYILAFRKLNHFITIPSLDFNPLFFSSIIDSFYFHTGWMGFKLAGGWYLVLKLFFVLAFAGIFFFFGSSAASCDPGKKKWWVYSLIVLVFYIFSIWFYYGYQTTSQGRYLYPLVVPFLLWLYHGLNAIESRFRFKRHYLLVSFLLFQVLLTVFALARVIAVFYLEIASPHIGL